MIKKNVRSRERVTTDITLGPQTLIKCSQLGLGLPPVTGVHTTKLKNYIQLCGDEIGLTGPGMLSTGGLELAPGPTLPGCLSWC